MNKKLILALFLLCNNIQMTKPNSQKTTESLSSWLNASDQYSRLQQLTFFALIGLLIKVMFNENKKNNELSKLNNELSKLNKNILDPDEEKVFCFLMYLNNSQQESESLKIILGDGFKAKIDPLIKNEADEDNKKSVDLLILFNTLNIKNSQKYYDEITDEDLKDSETRFNFINKKIKEKYLSSQFLKVHEETMVDKSGLGKSSINKSSIYKKIN